MLLLVALGLFESNKNFCCCWSTKPDILYDKATSRLANLLLIDSVDIPKDLI